MKSFKKIGLASFLSLYFLTGVLLFSSVKPAEAKDINFTPQIGIPNSTNFQQGVATPVGTETTTPEGQRVMRSDLLAKYIKDIYSWGLGIAGVIAVVSLMAAGLLWITSGGKGDNINRAKDMIKNSLIGLALLTGSYFLLNTINPNLANLPSFQIDTISRKNISKDFVDDLKDMPADTEIKYKCLAPDLLCKDTTPPSVQLDLSICREKLGTDFTCTYPEKKSCCAISKTLDNQANQQCLNKPDYTPCKPTLTSTEDSGWCHDNKCDADKVCCQCGQGGAYLYVYASCRNDLTIGECKEWCQNAWVGAQYVFYPGGSKNYTCKEGAYSYCNEKK